MEFRSDDIKIFEKAFALRKAKLYFRRNSKVLATPTQAEAENHIDVLADGRKWWMIQDNIDYFKEKTQKFPPRYPQSSVPEVICFLSSSEFNDGGIAMRFVDVLGLNRMF